VKVQVRLFASLRETLPDAVRGRAARDSLTLLEDDDVAIFPPLAVG